MTTKTFLIVLITVAALVAAAVYMHRPRSGSGTRSFPLHGSRPAR